MSIRIILGEPQGALTPHGSKNRFGGLALLRALLSLSGLERAPYHKNKLDDSGR